MCGFVGVMTKQMEVFRSEVISRMTEMISHRGPDDSGVWSDPDAGIVLGHRRLSILDLSPTGHQPMLSRSRRYVIVFNGEIYNHLDLRFELEKADSGKTGDIQWQGHSDTETLLTAFDRWGIDKTLSKLTGMFAFALWDKKQRCLILARDRVGEKPLYYGLQGQGDSAIFLFGSELKALRVHPQFNGEINRDAIALQLRHNYIPAPYSIYCGVSKLLPGHLLKLSQDDLQCGRLPSPEPYWSLAETAVSGVIDSWRGKPEDAVNQLDSLLREAIGQQMVADVPLGAFLSGGVDSSTIVALMQAQSSRPVNTFTIGFHEEDYNEAIHAKAVAKHLGTNHTELYVSSGHAMAVIPKLPLLYDEPFSDSSQIPTFLVSQLARQHVTVSLSGDAGDELFCGYNRYKLTSSLWNKLRKIPAPLRKLASDAIGSVSPSRWNQMARFISGTPRYTNFGDKLHKGAGVLDICTLDDLYLGLVSHWSNPIDVVLNSREPATALTGFRPQLSGLDSIQQMMALDILTYLPDDILVKVDRAAMGVSLETRIPFLDHRVVEFAWQLPQSLKLRDGQNKWVLRQILYRYAPKKLIERPKMGFGVPIDVWLRGPLRDWSEALLDETRLHREGFFNPIPIRKKWTEHLSGIRNWQHPLWGVLMFQAWLETQ